MDYPRQLNLDSKTLEELRQYIDDELTKHRGENSKFRQDLIDMQHSYWAEPSDEIVTFPFTGASNLVIPLNAIAVEAVHARNMQTIFGIPNQLVSARSISSDWELAARPVERFLDNELIKNVKVRKPINDSVLEIEKFGSGVGKTGYVKIIKRAMRTRNGKEEEFDVTVRSGARLDSVPISRFIMPFNSQDSQLAAWCGEEHVSTPYEIRQYEYSGEFKPGTYDAIKQYIADSSSVSNNEFERSQASLENRQPVMPSQIHWVEMWLSWNVDDDPSNKTKEICVYYHPDSRIFMSIRYNWYDDLRRPYRNGIYFPLEHRWMGLGICKMNTQFQEEVTTRHRLQLDNATLANIKMFKVNKQSGYGPNEPIFPGKIWFLDDLDYIDSVSLGEIYPSAYNSEQSTLNYSQQRLGINELTLGQPAAGTPGTASDVLARVQEGSKKFAFFYENIREFTSELITDLACCIQQFGPSDIRYFDTAEDGSLVEQFFKMPASMIRGGLLLDLKASGQLDNKFVDRQNYVQVTQTYTSYIQGILQLAELTQDPNILGEIIKRGMIGGTELMRQFLHTYDITNLDRILPNEQLIGGGGTAGIAQPTQIGGVQPTPEVNPATPGISNQAVA